MTEVKALFLGFSKRRVKSVVESIERVSPVSIKATSLGELEEESEALGEMYDVLFLDRKLGDTRLSRLLKRMRRSREARPAVLVYDSEPDGRAFAIASEHNCILYSEKDNRRRGLTPAELGEAIEPEPKSQCYKQRLMEVSMSSGPCSTGR